MIKGLWISAIFKRGERVMMERSWMLHAANRIMWGTVIGFSCRLASTCPALVVFDSDAQRIRVTDYPEAFPCTPALLLSVDRLFGWGKVTYEVATDTYTVTCDMVIGDNDATDTHFQTGSAAHPRETLIMRGNLAVAPAWIKGLNSGRAPVAGAMRVNRLRLGLPGNEAISSSLKFDCERRGQFGVKVGEAGAWGGQLHVHHGIITALKQDREHAAGLQESPGGMWLGGERIVLDHATMSWISGFMTYGMTAANAEVSDSIFEHGGAAIINAQQHLVRCVFRNCETAILDYGCLDAELRDCVFENNACNWNLAYSAKGLTLTDCAYGAPLRGNVVQARRDQKTGATFYPRVVSRRHVIVEATDEQGNGLAGAMVSARCEQDDPAAVEHGVQVTNERGQTAGCGRTNALLLTERMEQASDVAGKPIVKEYSYRLAAQAQGYEERAREGIKPTSSWEVIRVDLKKQTADLKSTAITNH